MKKKAAFVINNFKDQSFIRYLIIGITSFGIDYAGFNILYYLLSFDLIPSNMISFGTSLLFNYIATNYWTFSHGSAKDKKKLMRYLAVSLMNYILNNFFLFVFAEYLHIPAFIAKVIVIGMQVSWTFLIYKLWVFRTEEETIYVEMADK